MNLPQHPDTTEHEGSSDRPRHSWLMIACCIPMVVIAVALVATGVVGVGFIVVALACAAMMAMMMRGMDHGGNGPH